MGAAIKKQGVKTGGKFPPVFQIELALDWLVNVDSAAVAGRTVVLIAAVGGIFSK